MQLVKVRRECRFAGAMADKKPGKKNSQLILRLNQDERDAFVALCKENDTSAAREIRQFIRRYLKENERK